MNPILYAIPVFLLTLGLEAAAARAMGRRVVEPADTVTSLNLGVLSQTAGLFAKLAAVGLYAAVFDRFAAVRWPMDSALAWFIAAILYDFFYYWTHRFNHEVGVLWASHVVHHSSEYYNLSTALRQTSTSALFGWIFYLPMAVMGVPPAMFVTVGLINLLYQYWVHTELVGRLGWLDRVFVTPSNHRVHHGQNAYCIDVNYGGVLILWDRLFGTFAEERADEPVRYGVRKPLASHNPVWGNLHYYVELLKLSVLARRWRDRLGVWIAPPGGWAASTKVEESPSLRRFDAGAPRRIRLYALGQQGALNLMLVAALVLADREERTACAIMAALILAAALSLGALLERRAFAPAAEAARLACLAGLAAFAPDALVGAWQAPVRTLTLVFAILSMIALWRAAQTGGPGRSAP